MVLQGREDDTSQPILVTYDEEDLGLGKTSKENTVKDMGLDPIIGLKRVTRPPSLVNRLCCLRGKQPLDRRVNFFFCLFFSKSFSRLKQVFNELASPLVG